MAVANLAAVVATLTLISPSIGLWWYERGATHAGKSDPGTSAKTYAITGTIGMAVVVVAQSLLAYTLALVLFGTKAETYLEEFAKGEDDIQDIEHRELRKNMSSSWRYWIFLVILSFVVIAVIEEGLKYLAVLGARKWGRVNSPRDYVICAIASSLGFSTMENLGFIIKALADNEVGSKFALTVIERVLVGIPGHALTATLIACDIVARDVHHQQKTVWQILVIPVLFHGGFDLSLFAVSAYNGNLGWIHPRQGVTVYTTPVMALTQLTTLALIVNERLSRSGIVW